MPPESDVHKISRIFLSATAQDCKDYREAVRDFVQDNIRDAKIFLQENWAEGGRFVVDVCEQRVRSCEGYFGLFGYRYGWIPPGFTKSITELEFRWATDTWSGREPPIFVLLPEKSSEADNQLREWAESWTEREFDNEESRECDREAQRTFLAAVKKWAEDGRILVFYRNRLELLGKALCCVHNWNLELVRRASEGRRQTAGRIPDEELGRIGREEQREALANAIDAFFDRNTERAAAFLVHGPENHGQREFTEFLVRWDEWEEWQGMQVHCGQPHEADSLDSLIRWACSELGEPVLVAPTVDALANVLAKRLALASVVFVQRTAGRQTDRLESFHSGFWIPLLNALSDLSPGGQGRLFWLLTEHEALPAEPRPGIRQEALDDGDVDYRHLLALPPLGNIGKRQVRAWLKEIRRSAGIRLNQTRREEIVEFATEPDGNPPNVYDRLAREGFWAG